MEQGAYNNYLQPMPQIQPNMQALSAHQGMTPMYNANAPQQLPQNQPMAQNGPNAVSINIIGPQAYGSNPIAPQGYYPLYGPNPNNNQTFYYPPNYTNCFNTTNQQNQPQPQAQNGLKEMNDTNLAQKTSQDEPKKEVDEKKKTKKVTPLTNEYVQSLENYLDDSNPKVRLIGAKELIERFKEDENRKDNPSLIPLLNKSLRDTNSAVRFLGLTALQLGYCVGNDETVQILKEMQANSEDKLSEDNILASEILLKLCAPESQEIIDNSPDEESPKNPKEAEGEQ